MKRLTRNYLKNFSPNDVEARPSTLNAELTNLCNLRCVMCPQREMKRKRGFMDFALFAQILPEAVELGIKQCGLHTVGESILHPEVDRFVAESKKYGLYTYLDCNGNNVRPGLAERLILAGLDSLKFSIDAADPETYAQIRQGGDFAKVIENLKEFDRLRKALGSPMRLYAFYIIQAANESGVERFKEVLGPYVDEIEFFTVLNQGEQLEDYARLESPALREMMARHKKPFLCPNPFKRINLTYEGLLSACCVDFENAMTYGRYEPGKLKEIWFGEAAQAIRDGLANRDFSQLPLCRNCTMAHYDIPALCQEINELY